ncbi:uncharacterized protein LOC115622944 [Scaptodrosophila lebanonensis]|uniref:Uncharacterized protein LOC115622944 n=1 Tax=Drosophila lebanonensis TaxID=7225 RepID=A0A6J2TC23_DROLE|nr:uncharacterized protein LOC115622944 [Scaptodrosophila lebanonensis]
MESPEIECDDTRDDDNDSFHSFVQSLSPEGSCNSLHDDGYEFDMDITNEVEEDEGENYCKDVAEKVEPEPIKLEAKTDDVMIEKPSKSSSPDSEIHHDETATVELKAYKDQLVLSKAEKKLDKSSSNPLVNKFFTQAPRHSPMKNDSVTNNLQELSDDLFDMSLVAQKPTTLKRDAMQKYAFTEMWIGSQQKRSPIQDFATAMDTYFHNANPTRFDNRTRSDEEGSSNMYEAFATAEEPKLFDEPTREEKQNIAKTNSSADESNGSPIFAQKEEPYVSPFDDMPPMPPVKLIESNKKRVITVPAGFDLMNLNKYKDPNHWHIRSTTRNTENVD